eukprot:3049785-Amphidinium_carterae.2
MRSLRSGIRRQRARRSDYLLLARPTAPFRRGWQQCLRRSLHALLLQTQLVEFTHFTGTSPDWRRLRATDILMSQRHSADCATGLEDNFCNKRPGSGSAAPVSRSEFSAAWGKHVQLRDQFPQTSAFLMSS